MIYFGSSPFSARILQHLVDQKISIKAVVTQPPRPKGRSKELVPTSVAKLAHKLNLPLHEFPKASTPEALQVLSAYCADLFIVAAYGQILKQELLDIPPKGCINVHPSLLPKYRGAAPIQRCMMNGDLETGVTIMEVIKKLDAGDIILQKSLPIGPETLFSELESQLCDLSCELLVQAIKQIDTLARRPQDETLVTYADKIEPSDGELHWNRTAGELHNLVRAITGWCRVEIRDKEMRLKVLRSEIATNEEGLVVPCHGGALKLLEVQLEGKKPMLANDFLRGIALKDLLFI